MLEQEEQEQAGGRAEEGFAARAEGRGWGRVQPQSESDEQRDEEEDLPTEEARAAVPMSGCEPVLSCEFCGRGDFAGAYGLKIHQAINSVRCLAVKVVFC